MAVTQHTFCRICEALCGLEVDVEDGRVIDIRPDKDHLATAGFACLKGLEQHRMYDSPDRLRYPMKRNGKQWERVSWKQAVAEIGAKVRQLKTVKGPDSIAMYVGTAAGFGVLHPIFAQGFMHGLGSRSSYSSSTQDCANKFAVSKLMYGFPFTLPFPDIDRTECLIVVGANPVVSKWSFLQVSNPAKRLKAIEARGGKVWLIDPRRTESAKVAGEHVFIRPDTDAFFYLAFLRELFETGGVDRDRVRRFMNGLEEIERLARPWTPERAEAVTRIPADKLRAMVASYREADGAALYCSTGVNMGRNGSVGYWLQEVVNAVSGNLDRMGGTLVGTGIFDFAAFGKKYGVLTREDRSRIGDRASVNDAFPGGLLADEILTPGEGRVRALFVTGGNPLITMANAGRLRDAFEDLELLVTLDIYRNETGSLAHYALPCTSPLERPDLPFVFPLLLGLQSRPYLQATEPMIEPDGEQRDEATIYLELARASGVGLFGSKALQLALDAATALSSRKRPGRLPSVPQRALLSLLLRASKQPSFDELLGNPHGTARPGHRGGDFLGQRVTTDDGRVELAPAELLEAAGALEAESERELTQADRLKLITKRSVTTHNSWTHNIEDFVRREGGTNHLYVHPEDAERLGLEAGAMADVTSATATVRVPVRLLDDLMPGTVALPHGWGHQHATGLGVARRTTGVNVNLLAADGPESLEAVSGMSHLTGIVVEVRPAAGEQDGSNWSGLPSAGGGQAG